MALKFVIDTLEDVAEHLREHYVADGDMFRLDTKDPKVTEFRENNIKLIKDLARFEGVDPEEFKRLKAQGDDADVVKLKGELATEKAARAAAEAKVDGGLVRATISAAFLKAGGRPAALDFIVSKASDVLTVEQGVVTGKVFDPAKPGEKLTVESFIVAQVKESGFAFHPSSGGGAPSHTGDGSSHSRGKELVNPTPQELGQLVPPFDRQSEEDIQTLGAIFVLRRPVSDSGTTETVADSTGLFQS